MIYFNGDSHTYGIDLDPEQRFSNLVAQHFDHQLINSAKIGASNTRILRTTKQYLETNKPDLVVIGWSTWEREEWKHRGQYYDVNSSGHDVLPEELETQYKSWVSEQNEDTLKIKSDYWHNQIYNFHLALLKNKQSHLFFNCMYNFFDANTQDWHGCYIGPYDTKQSYYWYLNSLGHKSDQWYHYKADGHRAWAELLIDTIKL
jgi:hypothetical protein